MKYTVSFYQCGVYGIEPESYSTIKEARKAACGFLREFGPIPGHKRIESIYRDGYARIVDYSGGTEAMAEINFKLP